MGLIIVDAGRAEHDLVAQLSDIAAWARGGEGIVVRLVNAGSAAPSTPTLDLDVVGASNPAMLLDQVDGDAWVAYLPPNADFLPVEPSRLIAGPDGVQPWPVHASEPRRGIAEPTSSVEGWAMSAAAARTVLPHLADGQWGLAGVATAIRRHAPSLPWLSAPLHERQLGASDDGNSNRCQPHRLTRGSRILALIPHYACEEWLAEALGSLVTQTRPADGIAVIDDASEPPPIDVCRAFPDVTLLQSEENVGPYRLIQSVIERTDYDGYLFQDADDWSTCDRLALMLACAEETGAELIGTQEMRVSEADEFLPASYSLDVNAACIRRPTHTLLHPTSLVGRDLVMRIGGFASGLRFSGDTEFLYRAVFAGGVANIDRFAYQHRVRSGSLTTAPDTGMKSPARRQLLATIRSRGIAAAEATQEGRSPDLAPMRVAPPVTYQQVCGPQLRATT